MESVKLSETEDIMSLLYTYAASEYGKREAKNRVEKARKAVEE